MKFTQRIKYFSLFTTPLLLWYSCGQKKDGNTTEKAPTAVSASVVESGEFSYTEDFPAKLVANSEVSIVPDVSGYVKQINFTEGALIQKGQILYTIDNSRYKAAYDQAVANQRQSEAQFEFLKRDENRYQSLLKNDAISKQAYDNSRTAVRTAEASLAALKAVVNNAKTDLQYTQIRASQSGTIGISSVRVGDVVTGGQTIMNTLVREDPILAEFSVPEQRYMEFVQLKQQQSMAKLSLRLPDGNVYQEQGEIDIIDNKVDVSTGSIRVRVKFPNPNHILKSGMNAVIFYQRTTDPGTLRIPLTSIKETLGETNVFIVSDSNKAVSKKITPINRTTEYLFVKDGIKAGDKIITSNIQYLQAGEAVRIDSSKK
ncbi:efflux RND transporter periplasmic adaptor subunit [Chryseobacterium sp.]|uniref:efflux RND transporter periplasmic adaptor subunit n=1 Tax=Chryseobacterium sp. TaxID=1871047 RepID=UPI0025C382D0|nr:efflux RND transporter periplasmic adaptor subunit [Chryseobacterium sp.]